MPGGPPPLGLNIDRCIRDREFHSSKQVLEEKARELRQSGMGKRPNKATSLTEEEEELLWEADQIGSKTPEALISSMSWLLTQSSLVSEAVKILNSAKMTKV